MQTEIVHNLSPDNYRNTLGYPWSEMTHLSCICGIVGMHAASAVLVHFVLLGAGVNSMVSFKVEISHFYANFLNFRRSPERVEF